MHLEEHWKDMYKEKSEDYLYIQFMTLTSYYIWDNNRRVGKLSKDYEDLFIELHGLCVVEPAQGIQRKGEEADVWRKHKRDVARDDMQEALKENIQKRNRAMTEVFQNKRCIIVCFFLSWLILVVIGW